MKMPNNELSMVGENKITGYLLSETHELGKHKANFFKLFGFNLSDIETFRKALLQHAQEREVVATQETNFGNKYELKCEFKTPNERNPCIVTVWIIENNEKDPKLVTAYPNI